MGFRVRVRFSDPGLSTIHRIRNFGEDLWLAFRHEKRIAIDLDEIDRATEEVAYLVHNNQLRRSIKETERVLAKHLMTGEATITSDPA